MLIDNRQGMSALQGRFTRVSFVVAGREEVGKNTGSVNYRDTGSMEGVA